jgi:hypothetical protein
MVIKARIENGKLVGDAPPGYPEGAEFEVVFDPADDDMTEAEIADLNAAIEVSRRQFEAGEYVSEEEFLASLRARS